MADEKARYDEHQNDGEDLGYRGFLSRMVAPIARRCSAGARGLDFGCGPTPVLADMLRESGFSMDIYDPFYWPDRRVLDGSFDFVVCTEVLEHLRQPLAVFRQLLSLLATGGVLALMTRPYVEAVEFSSWHYKNDRTHIGFYSLATFDWLSRKFDLDYRQLEDDIFVFEPRAILRAPPISQELPCKS